MKEAGSSCSTGHQHPVDDDEARRVSADMEDIPFTEFVGVAGEIRAKIIDVITCFGEIAAGAWVVKDENTLGEPKSARSGFLNGPEPGESKGATHEEGADELRSFGRADELEADADPEGENTDEDQE